MLFLNPHSSGARSDAERVCEELRREPRAVPHLSTSPLVAALLVAASAALALGLFGCATTAGEPADPAPPRMQWPEPPLEPRVQFIQSYATEKSLGRESTRSEQLRYFLTGERPPSSHVYQPMDVAISDDGQRVYVSDFGQLVVFVFDLATRQVDQIGLQRPFAEPFGVALDGEGHLYVAEQAARRIVVLDREHRPLRVITHDRLVRPADIAIDRERGRLYVADPAHRATEQHTVKIFDLDGAFLGELGDGKGQCAGCLFFPTYVEVGPKGRVYVTSTLNARVDVFDADGVYVQTIGERGNAFGMFDKPKGIALDSFGNVYIVDSGWSTVQIFNPDGDVLLYFGGRGALPGLLRNPTGIAIGADNRIYVADYLNYRVSSYQLVNTTAEDSYPETDSAHAADGTAKTLPATGSKPRISDRVEPTRGRRIHAEPVEAVGSIARDRRDLRRSHPPDTGPS